MLTKLLTDLYIISLLDDEPNDVGGMSSAELKAKFDEAANTIKDYINNTLIPELAGNGGAESVGIDTVPGLTGVSTVQAALEKLENQMAEMTQGAVADNSITAAKLANLAVTATKLAPYAVETDKIKDDAVTAAKLAALAVTASKLEDLAVTTPKIADKAVTTSKIADKAVTNSQLGDACVGSDQLDALSVTASKIAALAVDTAKLKNGAVTMAKLADHAVSVDYTVTLDTTWSGDAAPYTKEQTINGILAADAPLIDLAPSATFADAEKQADAWALVYRAVTAANKITFYAKAKPTVSIPLQIRCIRK